MGPSSLKNAQELVFFNFVKVVDAFVEVVGTEFQTQGCRFGVVSKVKLPSDGQLMVRY